MAQNEQEQEGYDKWWVLLGQKWGPPKETWLWDTSLVTKGPITRVMGRCARRGGNRISSIPHQGGSWKLPVRSTCHTNAAVNILGMHRLCTSCHKDAVLTHSLTFFTIGMSLLQSSDIYIKPIKSVGYGSQDCPPKFTVRIFNRKKSYMLNYELLHWLFKWEFSMRAIRINWTMMFKCYRVYNMNIIHIVRNNIFAINSSSQLTNTKYYML